MRLALRWCERGSGRRSQGFRYPELNLAALTDKDLPEWVHEEVKLTATKAKDRPPPPAGQEVGSRDRACLASLTLV